MSRARDERQLVEALQQAHVRGASLVELIDLVHDWNDVPKYNRGIVMGPFHAAFGLHALDFTTILFACELFGDGASVSADETERRFRKRMKEIHVEPAVDPAGPRGTTG